MSAFNSARSRRWTYLLALVGLVVSGCRIQAPASIAPTLVAALPPAEATVPGPAATMSSPTDALWTPTVSPRPVRTKLEATDPATVSLANGTPTLVEFFAFW